MNSELILIIVISTNFLLSLVGLVLPYIATKKEKEKESKVEKNNSPSLYEQTKHDYQLAQRICKDYGIKFEGVHLTGEKDFQGAMLNMWHNMAPNDKK